VRRPIGQAAKEGAGSVSYGSNRRPPSGTGDRFIERRREATAFLYWEFGAKGSFVPDLRLGRRDEPRDNVHITRKGGHSRCVSVMNES
jgi:hypothetical protein